MKTDPQLGNAVKKHLVTLGLETITQIPKIGIAHDRLKAGVQGFLAEMGLDLNDPSIQDTPSRVAEMYSTELCAGLNYENFPKCTVTPNGQEVTRQVTLSEVNALEQKSGSSFKLSYADIGRAVGVPTGSTVSQHKDMLTYKYWGGQVDEMVMVRKINTTSLCEHHFQPIHGHTWIAYIPSKQLLGVSKFARVTNFFARRPQVQERMTEQVYAALAFILQTEDIAVYQVAVHGCMRHRGVMEPNSDMITSKMGGRFLSQPALRAEFLQGVKS